MIFNDNKKEYYNIEVVQVGDFFMYYENDLNEFVGSDGDYYNDEQIAKRNLEHSIEYHKLEYKDIPTTILKNKCINIINRKLGTNYKDLNINGFFLKDLILKPLGLQLVGKMANITKCFRPFMENYYVNLGFISADQLEDFLKENQLELIKTNDISSETEQKKDKQKFYTSKQWQKLRYDILSEHPRCCLCGRSAKDGVVLHVDHIVPISKDWSKRLDPNNLQVLCEDCNIGKSNKDCIDWR